MDETKALELSIQYAQTVKDSERQIDFVERSKRGDDYYAGLQTFSDEQLAVMQKEGKPAIKYNGVLPIINYLTSIERDNRKDIKVVERRGGYACVAELQTELAKHVMDMCDGDFVKSEVFLEGVKACRGWFKLEIDYDREPVTGQLIMQSRPALAVQSDPTCLSYDLNDVKNGAKFVIDTQYIYRDKLKAMYPDKAKDIDDAVEQYIGHSGRGVIARVADYLTDTTPMADFDTEVLFDNDLMQKWKAKVHETWIKEFVPRTLVCDKTNWEIWWLDPKKKDDRLRINRAKELANESPQIFEIREDQSMPLLHKLIRIGDLLLEHEEDPYNGSYLFPLIPFSPFGSAQYDMGVVDNLVGPQDELNKRMTNATHILNSVANGGHIIGKDVSGDYVDILRSFGSSPNMVIELDKCGGSYSKIMPTPVSPGHIELGNTAKNYMEEISGVSGASRGYNPSRQESGRLYREKVKQSMATNQIIYDRFDYSTKIMSQTLVTMLRRTETYTEQEVSYLIEDKDLVNGELLDNAREEAMQANPAPPNPIANPLFNQLAPENQASMAQEYQQVLIEYQEQINTEAIELGKKQLFEQFAAYRTGIYSVIVIQSPNAATTQISNFYELEALKDMVPPEILAPHMIRATGLPSVRKDEMIEKFEAMVQQVAAPPPV